MRPPAPKSDGSDGRADLGSRLLGGDQQVLADLLRRHGPAVLAGLGHRFRGALDATDLEDILAIALHDLWRNRSAFDPGRGSLHAWFLSIAVNVARNELRRRRRVGHDEARLLVEAVGSRFAGPDEEGSPPSTRLADAIRALIEGLPPKQRRIVEADIQAFPTSAPSRSLAEELEISEASVPVYRARARQKIRDELIRQGLWPAGAEDAP